MHFEDMQLLKRNADDLKQLSPVNGNSLIPQVQEIHDRWSAHNQQMNTREV